MENKNVVLSSMVMIQFIFLVFQFLLGMWISLFVPLNITPGYHMHMFFLVPSVMAHMMLGFLLLLFSILIIIFAVISGKIVAIFSSIFNLIFVFIAGISGIYFMLSGYTADIFSFTMAAGFIGVVTTDFVILLFN
ncbi:MAG: hypothetical protein JHC29_01155 [Thermoplasmata archaeon]|jgi:hypothetical protein|nr:hypothetical protein [Thermoplasmata archaeon]